MSDNPKSGPAWLVVGNHAIPLEGCVKVEYTPPGETLYETSGKTPGPALTFSYADRRQHFYGAGATLAWETFRRTQGVVELVRVAEAKP